MRKTLLYALLVLVSGFSCHSNAVKDTPISPLVSDLKTARLFTDSVRLSIPMGQAKIVQTNKGDLTIKFIDMDEFCGVDVCPTCDIDAGVTLRLRAADDSLDVKFSIRHCRPPTIFPNSRVFTCRDSIPYFPASSGSATIGKITYRIWEVTPYVNHKDVAAARINKIYTLHLDVRDYCGSR